MENDLHLELFRTKHLSPLMYRYDQNLEISIIARPQELN